MKFLIGLLFILNATVPAYGAATRTIVADQIKNSLQTQTYLFPASGDTLVGRTSTDTLTNKTLTTPAIDIPLFTDQSSTPATPAAGKRKFYSKTTGKFYQLDSAGIEREIGSGGTGTNFVVGGDAEGGSIFATYKDAVSASPADGTGGVPTVANITTTAVSPLVGANSFLLTHPASNVQGEGWSYDFTIDSAYQAKVLQLSFDYIVNSGTFVPGTLTTDSDVTVWIYDKTNNVLIQPSNYKLLSGSATVSDKFNATFQTASNSTSYRLIFHNATTSASAFTLRMDSVTVSPSTYVYGTPVTDWVAYTPTIVGFGTPTGTSFKWRRVGDSIQIEGVFTTGTSTAVLASFSLPNNWVIDTTKIDGANGNFFGDILLSNNGNPTSRKRYKALAYNNTGNVIYFGPDDYTYNAAPANGQLGNAVAGSGVNISVQLNNLPILGWSSSVQMSDQTDTRVVSYVGQTVGGAITANVTNIPFTTAKDTHGAWNGSQFTVPVPGDYIVSTFMAAPSTSTTWVALNGSVYRSIAYIAGTNGGGGSIIVPNLKTGDIISLRNTASQTLSASSDYSLNIFRISGPSAIAATESMNLSYQNTAGTAIGVGLTDVPFTTQQWDTHGQFSGTTFTPQIPGTFKVSTRLTSASVNLATNQTFFVQAVQAGSIARTKFLDQKNGNGVSAVFLAGGTATFKMLAGDTLKIQASSSVATTLSTTAGGNLIEIERIGN